MQIEEYEIALSAKLAGDAGCDFARIGNKIKFGGNMWTVVGRFDAGGSGFDSEIWGENNQLQDAFNRQGAIRR